MIDIKSISNQISSSKHIIYVLAVDCKWITNDVGYWEKGIEPAKPITELLLLLQHMSFIVIPV